MADSAIATRTDDLEHRLELHRKELTGYCYRMLGSPFEAEDAVQEAFVRAWRGYERFEGRSAFRSWLYRIATNVCLDMLEGRKRRALPMEIGFSWDPGGPIGQILDHATWIEPVPDAVIGSVPQDPADVAESRETVRLAFIAAVQHLPPRQRAVLILCEVLRWKASEVAELLDTSVASVNSALQRARATLEQIGVSALEQTTETASDDRELLERYVSAFERYDIDALTELIKEDAFQSMPPYELWLDGRESILAWWTGPGAECEGSRVLPAGTANGLPAFGQYRVSQAGGGWDPWALQVLRLDEEGIVEMTFFLDTDRLFPLFGLPSHLD